MRTRADVARLAGVSESTVSYVLSGKRPISEATKARVLDAIEKLGYKSNYAATALAGGSPRIVTVMISNLFTLHSSRIDGALVEGIVAGVRDSGFHIVIWPIANDTDSDIGLLVQSNFSGGVVLMNVKEENDERVNVLKNEKVPFVVVGRTNVDFSYNFVDRDFETVYKIALKRLKDLGHVNIGVLQSYSPTPKILKRLAASLKVKLEVIETANTWEGGIAVAQNFKAKYSKVTGIVSLIDAATVGFVNAAAEYSISIPKDLSIIGVNMLEEQAEDTIPQVDTVAFKAFDMAKSSGRILTESILDGKKSKKRKQELWVGDYMDRGSTAKRSTS